MAITNGYATLNELRGMLGIGKTYTGTGISFASGTKTIADTALGLEMYPTGARISVSGSTSNDGTYTVATGGVAGSIVVSESLVTEAAGDTVTITDVTDVVDDRRLERAIEGASRGIDNYEGRRFYRNATDETRYYKAAFPDVLFCPDDIGTVTTLATDGDGDRVYEDTWTATDFDLEPCNAALDGEAYTMISRTPDGDYTFPVGVAKGVKVIGKFGYSATAPDAIREACLLMAERLFKRKDAPFGIMGAGSLGVVRMVHKMIEDDLELALLLAPFRRVIG